MSNHSRHKTSRQVSEEQVVLSRGCKERNDKIAIHYVMYSGVNYEGPRDVTEEENYKNLSTGTL